MEYPLTGNFLAGRLRDNLSEDDLRYIETLVESVEEHGNATVLIERGQVAERSTLLIEGFVIFQLFSSRVRSRPRFGSI